MDWSGGGALPVRGFVVGHDGVAHRGADGALAVRALAASVESATRLRLPTAPAVLSKILICAILYRAGPKLPCNSDTFLLINAFYMHREALS